MKMDELPPFSPHRLFRGGHAQTLLATFTKPGSDPDRWWLDWRIVDWVGGSKAEG